MQDKKPLCVNAQLGGDLGKGMQAIITPVKLARPPLVQFPKGSTGGTSGLHRTA
jgi:hypothetical protein